MIQIGQGKNKAKSIAVAILLLSVIFGIGYLIGYFGVDFYKNITK